MPRVPRSVGSAALKGAQGLPALYPRIAEVLDGLAGDIAGGVLYVDAGSRDGTWDVLLGIANGGARVSLLRLSPTFRKEAALHAGPDRVEAGAATILDADGTAPPPLLPRFLEECHGGNHTDQGSRSSRGGETWISKDTAH